LLLLLLTIDAEGGFSKQYAATDKNDDGTEQQGCCVDGIGIKARIAAVDLLIKCVEIIDDWWCNS
jgi:hypothetical protein